jgi:hypothetical protein
MAAIKNLTCCSSKQVTQARSPWMGVLSLHSSTVTSRPRFGCCSLPCRCPPGTTTNGTGTGTDQDAADDCGMLAAGYTLNGITDKSPVLCPVGTYSDGGDLIASIVTQAQVDLLCTSCPTSQWTLEPGATSDADCTCM